MRSNLGVIDVTNDLFGNGNFITGFDYAFFPRVYSSLCGIIRAISWRACIISARSISHLPTGRCGGGDSFGFSSIRSLQLCNLEDIHLLKSSTVSNVRSLTTTGLDLFCMIAYRPSIRKI